MHLYGRDGWTEHNLERKRKAEERYTDRYGIGKNDSDDGMARVVKQTVCR